MTLSENLNLELNNELQGGMRNLFENTLEASHSFKRVNEEESTNFNPRNKLGLS